MGNWKNLVYQVPAARINEFRSFIFLRFISRFRQDLGDKIGKEKVLILDFLLFRAFTAVTGWAKSWSTLLFAEGSSPAGEGTYYGPQYGLSSRQIPKNTVVRSAALSSTAAWLLVLPLGLMAPAGWCMTGLQLAYTVLCHVDPYSADRAGYHGCLSREKAPARRGRQGWRNRKSKFTDLFKTAICCWSITMVFCSLFGFFVILTGCLLPANERGIAGSETGFLSPRWSHRISIPGALLFLLALRPFR